MSAAAALDRGELGRWLAERRWFGSKSRALDEVCLVDSVTLDPSHPPLEIALVEVRYEAGAPEVYQLPLAIDPHDEAGSARIAAVDDSGSYAYDALARRRDADRLLSLITDGGEALSDEGDTRTTGGARAGFDGPGSDLGGPGSAGEGRGDSRAPGGPIFDVGRVDLAWIGEPLPPGASARPIAGEQSNTSVVYGENAILKAYRRIEPGPNPELEMLRFLGARGFGQVPGLLGWYEYSGPALEATLGVVCDFIADGRDGWELTLDGLSGDAESLLEPLRGLGATVGAMHTTLASDPDDPAFAPEPLGADAVARFTARVEEEIESVFADLSGDERLAPIARRGEELRRRLHALGQVGGGGMATRVHGDLHLGQTLWSDRGWTLLDFEGEPARPLSERRARHSPLRDVAGVLRSLAYAPAAARIQRGVEPPADWERRARERFLDGYREAVDPALLPPSERGIDGVLALHELEKAVYELRYELNNRPDWVDIPVAGITRLLEVEVA